MKKLMFVLCMLAAFSCSSPKPEGESTFYKNGDYTVKTINSHEYLEYDAGLGSAHVYSLTHSGECKKCKEELKILIMECLREFKNSENN